MPPKDLKKWNIELEWISHKYFTEKFLRSNSRSRNDHNDLELPFKISGLRWSELQTKGNFMSPISPYPQNPRQYNHRPPGQPQRDPPRHISIIRNEAANETDNSSCCNRVNNPTCIKIIYLATFGGLGGLLLGSSFIPGESNTTSAGLRWSGVTLLGIAILPIIAMCWGPDEDANDV